MTNGLLHRSSVVLLWAIACLFAGALVIVGVVCTSTTGARWAVYALTGHVPGLYVARIDGTLLRGLVLEDVRYAAGELAVELRRLVAEPSFAQVAKGRLVLQRLEIEGGSVNVPPASGPPTLPRIPESVAVRSLRISNVAITGSGQAVLIASAAGAVDGPRLEVDSLHLRASGVSISGSGAFVVAPEALRGSLDARVSGSDDGQAAMPGATPPGIGISADVVLAPAADPWFAAVRWTRLTWADSPAGDLRSPNGRVVVAPGGGSIDIELEADLETEALPDTVSLTADARLANGTLELRRFALKALGGEVTARGAFGFAERDGRFRITGHDLDPSGIDARLTGHVDARVDVTLTGKPVPRLFAAGTVDGKLRGRRLGGQFRGTWSEHTLELDRAHVRLGDVTLQGAGRIAAESTDLSFAVDVPRIPPLDELGVTIDGSPAAHTVRLRGRSSFGSVRAEARQHWDGEALRGALIDSTVAITEAGTWRLAEPAEYAIGGATAEFEPICYTGPGRSRLCGKLHEEQLSIKARELPSRLAEPWLPGDLELLGAADADLELDWRGPLRGSVSLHQPSLILGTTARSRAPFDSAAGTPLRLEVIDLDLQAVLDDERLQARLLAGFPDSPDRIEAKLKIEPPLAEGALSGRLVASFSDLALLETVIDGVEGIEGSTAADISVLGTPAAPEIRGTMELRSLGATVPPLGIEVTRGSFSARAENLNEVIFDGELCTQGCVTFDGRLARPLERDWRVDAELAGERFELFDIPQLRAVLAPDLELSGDGTALRVSGTVGVNEAAVVVSTVPRTAVRPAPETVVHGRDAAYSRNPGALTSSLALDVRARLGDVRFEGLGLEAELGGTLDVERTLQGRWFVQGTTEVEHGTFEAYGQEFAIERGLLVFTGRPDDPSLDIRATREVENARVGLGITGTLHNPIGEVIADSDMSDSEAFAQLVTGIPLAGAVVDDDDSLERIARNFGLRQILPTLDRLRTSIGLDEFGMSGANPGDAVLVAGEQLGSSALLCYKHGLFDDFTGLELIYAITDRSRLHTKSGSAQSIDLVYEVGPVDTPPAGCRRSGAGSR